MHRNTRQPNPLRLAMACHFGCFEDIVAKWRHEETGDFAEDCTGMLKEGAYPFLNCAHTEEPSALVSHCLSPPQVLQDEVLGPMRGTLLTTGCPRASLCQEGLERIGLGRGLFFDWVLQDQDSDL